MIPIIRVDNFSETNGGPHRKYFPANIYTRPSKFCVTGKDVLWMLTNFTRSRMLTRVDMAKLISTNFFAFIQCYRKVNRRVKWREGNERFS